MKKNNKLEKKKILSYLSNLTLGIIILILIVPSWRVSFQGWFQGFFIQDVHFSEETSIPIPIEAKNWELFDMDDNLFNFADFEGKPIVLNFWATWCGSCRTELPEINELKEHYKDKIVFISVTEETPEIVKETGLDEDYSFLYSTQFFPSFYSVSAFPTLVLIDKEMNQVFKTTGAGVVMTEKNISFLDKLLQN
jgi:thiol-disulfide isomerase/thioredoxin